MKIDSREKLMQSVARLFYLGDISRACSLIMKKKEFTSQEERNNAVLIRGAYTSWMNRLNSVNANEDQSNTELAEIKIDFENAFDLPDYTPNRWEIKDIHFISHIGKIDNKTYRFHWYQAKPIPINNKEYYKIKNNEGFVEGVKEHGIQEFYTKTEEA